MVAYELRYLRKLLGSYYDRDCQPWQIQNVTLIVQVGNSLWQSWKVGNKS
jgi:hypothetical protein